MKTSLKTYIQTIFLLSVAMAFAPQSFAQSRRTYSPGTSAYGSSISYGYQNEFITNFTSGSIVSEKPCTGPYDACKSRTSILLQGAYLHSMNSNIQAGAQVIVSKPVDDTLFTLVALGVYNFENDFKNAFFVQGGIGIYPVLKPFPNGYESKLGIMIGAGKRFPIWDRINYIPSISLLKKGDLDVGFDVEFLNFSIMF